MVLTSATCPEPVQRLIETWVANPVVLRVKVRKSNATAASAASGTTATEVRGDRNSGGGGEGGGGNDGGGRCGGGGGGGSGGGEEALVARFARASLLWVDGPR